ncbi:MAG: Mov34/MPN/PAD-1 family protein [Anaerovoracaceae bacterium]|nr:Mov34/MPN/PAD-1 family protein [Bacillota bacterium]MDY2670105.1 Mov34/MPN/PAD-1 family protein [Anaerovoracaceae bacterium]
MFTDRDGKDPDGSRIPVNVIISDRVFSPEGTGQRELTQAEKWILKSPFFRSAEVEYINSNMRDFPAAITESGDLQQPFEVSGWIFLLVLDKSFPRKTEKRDMPAKVYLVSPGIPEFKELYGLDAGSIPYVREDDSGMHYLYIEQAEKELDRYVNNRSSRCMSETMQVYTAKWTQGMQKKIEAEKKQQKGRKAKTWNLFGRGGSEKGRETVWTSVSGTSAEYSDGRLSRSRAANPRCRKVVLSDRAFIQIFNESQSRLETETGGLLLGHYDKGVWYVIEASDPGIDAVFQKAYHEGDDVYQNHVCDVISRTYKHPLVFLGMWHRHPGSLDSFSGTDDITNRKYAVSAGNGCISAIINYDPDFRVTFYYVELDGPRGVKYTQVDVEVGDGKIGNKEIMKLADVGDVLNRME